MSFTSERLTDEHIKEGLKGLEKDRTHGPYKTAEDAIKALEARAKTRTKKRRA